MKTPILIGNPNRNRPLRALFAAAGILASLNSAMAQGSFTWDGGATPNGNWNAAANWNPDSTLANNFFTNFTFAGGVNLLATNNLTGGSISNNLTFAVGAGSFILSGSAITNRGGITNLSGVPQTINFPTITSVNSTVTNFAHYINTGASVITNGGQFTAPTANASVVKVGTGTLVFNSPLTNILGNGTPANALPGGATTQFLPGFSVDEGTVIFDGGSSSVYSNLSEVTFGRGSATANKDVTVVINSGTFSANNWLGIMRGNSDAVLGTLNINGSSIVMPANWSGCFNAGDATRKPRAVVNHNGTSLFWVNNNAAGNDNFSESAGAFLIHNVNDSATLRCGSGVAGQVSRARVGIAGRAIIRSTSPTAAIVFGQMHLGDAAGGAGIFAGAGAVYNRGLFTNNSPASTDHFSVGSAGGTAVPTNNGYGYFLHDSASPITLNEIGIGGAGNGDGVLEIRQGTININNWITITRGQSTTAGAQQSGLLMIRNGTMVGPAANQDYMIQSGSGISQYAVMDIGAGGKLGSASAAHQMNLANANNALSFGTLTLSGGGAVEITSIFAGNAAPLTCVNFNNGTLKAMANTATFLGNNIDGAFVHTGGATIDSAGFNVSTVPQLAAPTGNGITSIPVSTTGIGYIGRPIVRIADASGIGATAIADWSETNGTVTNITITCPGSGYSAPTVTLVGGGYTNIATLGAPVLGAVTSGGLTKNGVGTLTLLNGATYTGNTVINGGALALVSTMPFASSSVTVTNSALNADVTSGSTLNLASLTLQNNATNSINYGNLGANPTFSAITVSGALSAPGSGLVINIDGFGLQVGTFPVIDYTGAALGSVANFSLGTLPPGVSAYLSNNVANTSVDIVITASGQNLVWSGSDAATTLINSNWDITISTNWTLFNTTTPASYQEYTTTTTVGDPVRFDDTLTNDFVNPQPTNINLVTTVRPFKVTVDSTLPYSITGAGSLTGAGSVIKSNTGSIFLGTSNSYTGGTVVYGGSVIITNEYNLGAASSTLTLASGTLQINGNTTNTRPIIVTAESPINVASGVTALIGSKFTSSARTLFRDLGTAMLTNQMNFPFHVSFGTVIFDANAKITNTASFSAVGAGTFAAENANLIIRSNATFDMTQDFNIGDANDATGRLDIQGNAIIRTINLWVGKFNTTVGRVFQTGGILTNSATSGSDWQIGGANAAAAGSFGGYYQSGGRVDAFKNFQVGAYGSGELTITGGTWNQWAGFPVVGRFTNGVGNMVVANGGTFNHLGTGQFMIVGEQGTGTLTVSNNGTVFTTNILRISHAGNGIGTVNVAVGGRLIAPGIVTTGPGISSTINFSGGTLRAGASSTTFMQGLTTANILAGGAIIDSTNFNLTIGQPLLDAGGGGGLTKVGPGALTLSGSNTYSGATVISGGRVLFTPAHQTPSSAVTVANSSGLGVLVNGPGKATVGNVALGAGSSDATTTDIILASGTGNNPTNSVLSSGSLTVNGTNSVRLTGRIIVGTFPIWTYTGAILGSGVLNPTVTGSQGIVASLSNDVANSTLYITVTSTGPGLVWSGTNSTAGLTNLWDLSGTTNWLLSGTRTAYQETTPPGDSVTFNDVGTGIALLNVAASPASVLFSNAINYTLSGTGRVTGVTGIIKQNTGTTTIALTANDYTGVTTINAGTLQLGRANIIPGGPGTGGLSINTNGTLDLNAFNDTVNGLSGYGTINNSGSTTAILTNGFGDVGGTWNGTVTNTGVGGVTLNKVGTGALKIGGTNFLTGVNQFNGGSVELTPTAAVYAGEFWLGSSSTAVATNNGGSLVTSSWLVIGRTIASASGTLVINSGTVQKAGANHVVVGSVGATGTLIVNGGQLLNNGNLWLGEGTTANASLYLNGGLVQATQVRPNGGTPLTSFAYFNGGTLQASAASTSFIQSASFVMTNGLILDDNGFSLNIVSVGLLDGDGLGGGLRKLGSGAVYLDANNTYTGTTVVSNGILAGIGNIASAVVVAAPSGKLGAGDAAAIGTLTINNSLTIQGAAMMRIDRTAGVTNSDLVTGLTNVNYGGTLIVSNVTTDATPLAVGNQFTLFSSAAHAGNFTSIVGSSLATGLGYKFTNGVLSIVATVNVNPTNLTAVVNGSNLELSWPTDHLGWRLQAQTNNLATGLSGNWVDVAGTSTVNSVTNALNAANGSVFYRMVYP